jgi:hypothetical protein
MGRANGDNPSLPVPRPAVTDLGTRGPMCGAGNLIERQKDTPSVAFDPAPSACSILGLETLTPTIC